MVMPPAAQPVFANLAWFRLAAVCSLLVVMSCGALWADSPEQATPAEKKPGEPRVIQLDGTFESPATTPLKAGTKEIRSLTVERVVAHGTTVEKGQNVIWLKTEDIDKQIAEAELDLRLAKVAWRDAEFKFKQFEQAQRLDRQAAEQARNRAREDYDHFVRTEREQQIKRADFNLKNAEAALENAEEELAQLEKMYLADDLTEESEEIVLRRAKRVVENYRFQLESSQLQTARTLDTLIPRSAMDQESGLARAELTYQSAIGELDLARARREIELAKEQRKLKDQQRRLESLQADRKRMVITAPYAGIVFHGTLVRGSVGDKPTVVEPGVNVASDQVIATIVAPKPLRLRVAIPEDQLRHLKVGSPGLVTPTSFPDQRLEATIQSISQIPYMNRQFDAVVTVKLGKLVGAILPTMNARVEFTVHESEQP